MSDLKSTTKNCIESVKQTHATENEKTFVSQWYLEQIQKNNNQ